METDTPTSPVVFTVGASFTETPVVVANNEVNGDVAPLEAAATVAAIDESVGIKPAEDSIDDELPTPQPKGFPLIFF